MQKINQTNCGSNLNYFLLKYIEIPLRQQAYHFNNNY